MQCNNDNNNKLSYNNSNNEQHKCSKAAVAAAAVVVFVVPVVQGYEWKAFSIHQRTWPYGNHFCFLCLCIFFCFCLYPLQLLLLCAGWSKARGSKAFSSARFFFIPPATELWLANCKIIMIIVGNFWFLLFHLTLYSRLVPMIYESLN